MAEPLKNHFTIDVAHRIAAAIVPVWPAFRSRAFVADTAKAFDALELMDRGRHIARMLRRYLPDDYPTAVGILLQSAGERPIRAEGAGGMASFFYLPHVCFVAEFGLDHFHESMQALHALTQRFTSEFSIRPFIERYEREALALLREWTRDPNVHVRRLVSEGTRPRLPWAGRLRRFQHDPSPVLELLEMLRDDPEEYVRRSVANNLNDIAKDHPDLLVDVARRWLTDASPEPCGPGAARAPIARQAGARRRPCGPRRGTTSRCGRGRCGHRSASTRDGEQGVCGLQRAKREPADAARARRFPCPLREGERHRVTEGLQAEDDRSAGGRGDGVPQDSLACGLDDASTLPWASRRRRDDQRCCHADWCVHADWRTRAVAANLLSAANIWTTPTTLLNPTIPTDVPDAGTPDTTAARARRDRRAPAEDRSPSCSSR